MKNILVPTDFSDCAKSAEAIGLNLAKKCNAEIHFLHLLSSPVEWVKLPLDKEELYPEIKAQIGHAKNELSLLEKKAEKNGVQAKTFLIFNKGKEEIYHHLDHHKHDFIVMGSHGASGLNQVIGSNTQRVIRHSPVPVLVVKEKSKQFAVKNIVFAAAFEEDVHQPFLKTIEFAEKLDAKIHLLNVNTPFHFKETDEIEAEMRKFLKRHPEKECTINIFDALNEERGIKKFAKKINADLIAMTTHGKTGFMKMISPSITENLVNHADTPILSINSNIK